MERTVRLQKVIGFARTEASRSGNQDVNAWHLLRGILLEGGSVPAKLLAAHRIDMDDVQEDPGDPRREEVILADADVVAQKLNHTVVGTEHVLLAILANRSSPTAGLLVRKGVQPADVCREILEIMGKA